MNTNDGTDGRKNQREYTLHGERPVRPGGAAALPRQPESSWRDSDERPHMREIPEYWRRLSEQVSSIRDRIIRRIEDALSDGREIDDPASSPDTSINKRDENISGQ